MPELEKLANFKNGKALSQKDYTPTGKWPVYGSNGVIARTNEVLNEGKVISIGRVGAYCGAVYAIRTKSWVTDNAIIAEPKDGTDYDFLYYLLSSLQLNRTAIGSAQPLLTQSGLKLISIPLIPDHDTQKKIGKILKTIDDKVELNRDTNGTLEKIAQEVFKSWFVNFDPVHAKKLALEKGLSSAQSERAAMAIISGVCSPSDFAGNFEEMDKKLSAKLSKMSKEKQEELAHTASLFPNEFEESELGDIPISWKIESFGNIVKRLKPKRKYTKKNVLHRGKTIVYEQGSSLILGYTNDEADFECSPKEPMFIFGDHTCVMKLSAQSFSISANVIPLEGKEFPTAWVYYACLGRQKFEEYRRHWSEFIVKNAVLPSLELAELFSKLQLSIQEKKEDNLTENNLLEDLRDTLLPKLLAGEINLSKVVTGEDL